MNTHHIRAIVCLSVLLMGLIVSPSTEAVTRIWDGDASDSDWFNPTNWDGNTTIPGAGEDVSITSSGGAVTLSNATAAMGTFTITNNTLTFSDTTNLQTKIEAVTVIIENLATLTHLTNSAATTNSAGEWPADARVYIVTSNMTIKAGGKIIVDEMGFGHDKGPGAGSFGPGGWYGGGGYGGIGGARGTDPTSAGQIYGSASAPAAPGSGGGDPVGEPGGGLVRIAASGQVTINGVISADGGTAPNSGSGAGAGSGGGIHITCSAFSGTNGVIRARGGDHLQGSVLSSAGGGGRIAIVYNATSQSNLTTDSSLMTFDVSEGSTLSDEPAQPGTLYFPDATYFPSTNILSAGVVVIPGFTTWNPPVLSASGAGIIFTGLQVTVSSDISVNGNGKLEYRNSTVSVVSNMYLNKGTFVFIGGTTAGTTLSIGGDLIMTNQGVLEVASRALTPAPGTKGVIVDVDGIVWIDNNSWIRPTSNGTNGSSPFFELARLTIEGGASAGFDATATGYSGPGGGPSPGVMGNGGWSAGGGHGGNGGDAAPGAGPLTGLGGSTNDVLEAPELPGSSHGRPVNGEGGGVVRLDVSSTLTIDGSIIADGYSFPAGDGTGGGGGAGGSIYITCRTLAGSSAILQAKGGNARTSSFGAAGGGGRIAIWRQKLTANTNTWTISVAAGTAFNSADPGTVFWGLTPFSGTVIVVK